LSEYLNVGKLKKKVKLGKYIEKGRNRKRKEAAEKRKKK
jgi:hypothetical protein